MRYWGRPGLSPFNAALVASGHIQHAQRILEVGTGSGQEAIGLAKLGFHLVATDQRPTGMAERNARRARVANRIEFRKADALHLSEIVGSESFDVVLDVLTYNNVLYSIDGERRIRDVERYAEEVADVLTRGGVWSIQWRAGTTHEHPSPAKLKRDLPSAIWSRFRAAELVITHVPEYVTENRRQGYAPIAAVVLERK
jgi:SAM-dependent methyltransferase